MLWVFEKRLQERFGKKHPLAGCIPEGNGGKKEK